MEISAVWTLNPKHTSGVDESSDTCAYTKKASPGHPTAKGSWPAALARVPLHRQRPRNARTNQRGFPHKRDSCFCSVSEMTHFAAGHTPPDVVHPAWATFWVSCTCSWCVAGPLPWNMVGCGGLFFVDAAVAMWKKEEEVKTQIPQCIQDQIP